MATDNRTAHLNLPLPDPANKLSDDVLRIILAFSALDTKIAALDTLLASSDVNLDTLQELVSFIKNDNSQIVSILQTLALKANSADVDPAGTSLVLAIALG